MLWTQKNSAARFVIKAENSNSKKSMTIIMYKNEQINTNLGNNAKGDGKKFRKDFVIVANNFRFDFISIEFM